MTFDGAGVEGSPTHEVAVWDRSDVLMEKQEERKRREGYGGVGVGKCVECEPSDQMDGGDGENLGEWVATWQNFTRGT